jgi:hypothetical protein
MKSTFRLDELSRRGGASFKLLQLALCISSIALTITGCGGNPSGIGTGSGSGSTGPINGESTTVAIQLSSTANDEFIYFGMEIKQISLTNKAGVTTTIFSTPTDVDFIPANGNAAPFATVTVPQDVYTSAAVAVSGPAFSNVSMTPQGGIDFNTDAYGYTPTPPVVNLAGPITVEGTSMGLILNLLAAQSGSYTGLEPNQTAYTINPTFDLTPFTIPAEAATPLNGKCIGLAGEVTAVDSAANTMTVTLPGNPATGNPSLNVALDANTEYQGIASASGLTAGTLIDMDIALQPDASYAATRVEVPDATATNVATGQLAFIDPSYNVLSTAVSQQVGSILSVYPIGMGYEYAYEGGVKYQTSARFPNLSSLPFTAKFSSATVAAGQMVSIGSTSISDTGGTWTLPTSVTLVPQTIDAAVKAESTSGDYTIYTVELAPYDLIAQMNSPAGPAVSTILPNATTVYVYTDASTSLLNSASLGVGSTFRFNGLLFNDAGTLRMVAGQVNDGVAQ